MKDFEKEKMLAAQEAVKFIESDMIVGLGTGSTAFYAINEIGKLVKNGFKIKAVATSNESAALAASLNIDVIDINAVDSIDITIDGADEFTSEFLMIKGGGGALFREKVVAAMTKKEIIIADSSKKVAVLGKFKVPVEVVPFAYQYVLRQLAVINGKGTVRMKNDTQYLTDQGNFIIDADFGLISDPKALAAKLNEIEGVAAHGLFIGLTHTIIMGERDTTIIFKK
ncbi:ribose-5-phosphate isomerase RpiA [Flavobacterium hungaricum]|uniref:Ribose-5-phosphate isomerase A n=1 Tax=Flavobacterium hungaricum TaxID=2082725 RepID=A0ABR9THT1_9FLAO|nr:ribose-5-phosphate isomerase RpiA [Flavobacterium hungaricum]MBE8724404.1 ribose-5-phosphate isomerase RpiA [Flavobacterium hungaricum]